MKLLPIWMQQQKNSCYIRIRIYEVEREKNCWEIIINYTFHIHDK